MARPGMSSSRSHTRGTPHSKTRPPQRRTVAQEGSRRQAGRVSACRGASPPALLPPLTALLLVTLHSLRSFSSGRSGFWSLLRSSARIAPFCDGGEDRGPPPSSIRSQPTPDSPRPRGPGRPASRPRWPRTAGCPAAATAAPSTPTRTRRHLTRATARRSRTGTPRAWPRRGRGRPPPPPQQHQQQRCQLRRRGAAAVV